MSSDVAIAVEEVGKAYRIWESPAARILAPAMEGLARFVPGSLATWLYARAGSYYRDFWALRNINFLVHKGEAVGIIGRNGSGKSTLLQIIAGTLQPTEGRVQVKGRVAALLELGSGFNPEFTGRENVYLNGAVLGLSRAEVEARLPAIISFADIGDFLDQPVKTYSSGMVIRLAFAVQVQVEPDILIIDEALAVGDLLFQKRCFEQMRRMLARGTTLLLVTHDPELIRSMTSRALLLREGLPRSIGPSAEIVLDYRRETHEDERLYLSRTAAEPKEPSSIAATAAATTTETQLSYGDMDAVISNVRILNGSFTEVAGFRPGEKIVVEISYRILRPLTRLNVGFRLRNKEGIKVYSGGTFANDVNLWCKDPKARGFWHESFEPGETLVVCATFECILGPNLYEVQAFICEEQEPRPDHQRMIHWKDQAAFFMVTMDRIEYWFGGVCDLKVKSTFSRTAGS